MSIARIELGTAVGKVPVETQNDRQTVSRLKSLILNAQLYGLAGITFLSFLPRFSHVQEYAFFLLLAVGLAFCLAQKINPFVRTRLDLVLVAFVVWVLFTVPFSVDPIYSFAEWRKVVGHILVFYWAMFVLRFSKGREPAGIVLAAVVLGSLALSILALDDFLSRGGTWRDREVRAVAPSSDYNWLTTYLVLVVPVILGWLANQRGAAARTLGLFAVTAAGFAQIAAYTRAGWIAHFSQLVAFLYMVRRRQVVVWFFVGAILAASTVIALSSTRYQKDTLDPWTFAARVKTWQLGIEQVLHHPIVGAGFGNDTFSKVYTAQIEADSTKGPVEKVLPGLHNTFMMVLMGSGVPALILFAFMFIRIVTELGAGHRRVDYLPKGIGLLAPAISLAVLGFAVRNAFDYMFAGSVANLFWILVAVGLSVKDDPANSNGQDEPGRTSRSI
ncbi:MAG TPA: O-antigen ligase family protein [Nitrospira sp.]|nr:O-antigen ligase family protein [Nitrospira sp.]